MTRKEFLRAAGMSAAGLAVGHVARLRGAEDEDLRRRLTLLVQEYDRQGNHRAGSRPDTVSAQWLSTAMQTWRVSATLDAVPLERVDPVASFVQFRERRIEGVPLYDGTFTDAAGVYGRLGLPEAGTEIALLDSDAPAWTSIRRNGTRAAIVLVTRGRRPGLTLQDAPDFAAPFGPPVLQVSSEEGDWLRQQAEKPPDVRLVLEVRRAATQAFNVLARVRGRDPSLPPLVVSAPRSAWWRGTGERGGALAVKFEAAYLRKLDFDDVTESDARMVYNRYAKGGEASLADYKKLQDYLFRYIAREAGRLGLVVHIHVSAGAGAQFEISGASPLLLDPALSDPSLTKTNFVSVHGGWPFTKEIAFLLNKPNVFADFSAQTFLLSPRRLSEVIRDWLELCPEKALFGTDAFQLTPEIGWEEAAWFTTTTAREALAMALTGMIDDGLITRERASELARLVMRENAIKLYGLKTQ